MAYAGDSWNSIWREKRHLNLAARDTKNFSDNKVKVCGKKF
jgi:hypothetical protein